MAAGKKTIKMGLLVALLSIPRINIVVGAAMVTQIIYSGSTLSGYLE